MASADHHHSHLHLDVLLFQRLLVPLSAVSPKVNPALISMLVLSAVHNFVMDVSRILQSVVAYISDAHKRLDACESDKDYSKLRSKPMIIDTVCRVDPTCTYNAPNYVSAYIVSMVTQQTIGAISANHIAPSLPLLMNCPR